jgi:cobalt-zinc-cadmium efflux system protein
MVQPSSISPAPGCDCCPNPYSPDPIAAAEKLTRLRLALLLIGGFALTEGAIAHVSHSLALLAESVHMISDCLALGLALFATWLAQRPAGPRATFGYRRIEILAALVNGVGLLAIALWIGGEAIAHLQTPQGDILTTPMLITALLGFGVNVINASLLHHHSHHDLNVRGAFLHMVGDAASSLGVVVAAIAVALWGWTWADSLISLGVAVLIGVTTLPLMGQSLQVLLETVPAHLNPDDIRSHLLSFEPVSQVQQLHLWAIAPGQVILTAHLLVSPTHVDGRDRLLHELQTSLHQTFGISQCYLQMTHPYSALLSSLPSLSSQGEVRR